MSENKSRVEKTFEVLRNEILLGQYRPGERLPSERDLSARFEVTRNVVRESIKKLEQLGIASVTPGGVRVLPIEDATLEILGALLDLGEIQNCSCDRYSIDPHTFQFVCLWDQSFKK